MLGIRKALRIEAWLAGILPFFHIYFFDFFFSKFLFFDLCFHILRLIILVGFWVHFPIIFSLFLRLMFFDRLLFRLIFQFFLNLFFFDYISRFYVCF